MLKGFSSFSLPDRLARLVLLAVIGLAAWNWLLDPSDAGRWARTMFGLPAIWAAISVVRWRVLRVRAPRREEDEAVRRYADATLQFLTVFIAAIGLVLGVSLGFEVAGNLDLIEGRMFEARVIGLMSGAIFVLLGNGLPKINTPVSMLPDGGAERISRMRRFIGRSWVLVGLIVIVAFAFAPLELAQVARRWGFVASVVAMIGGILWVNLWPDRRPA